MDRFVLVMAAIGTAVLIGLGALWALRDYATPHFVNGAQTADRIDSEVGDLIAARFPAATVGAAHCPPLLDLTAHRTAECTLPVSGNELHLTVDSDFLRGFAPMQTTDALFVTQDAERTIAARLAQKYGERFDVRCPGPEVRVTAPATPVNCSVEAPDVARRGIEVTANGYAGAVYAELAQVIPTRDERMLGRDVAERTEGGVVIAGSSMERYVRGSASANERGEVGRRRLVGRAQCPSRIVLREGSHARCTVRVGGLPLHYDVHFEKGFGLRVEAAQRVIVVAALREVAVRYFERPHFTGGKPVRARVDCGTAAVVFVEPGSSVPCTTNVAGETYAFAFQIDDANGAFRILPNESPCAGSACRGPSPYSRVDRLMRSLSIAAAVVALALPCAVSAATFVPDDEARIVGLSSPVFSPDGARVALVRTVQDVKADKSHTAIVTVDVTSGALRALTAKVEGVAQPTYSPDGRQLAFLAFDKKHQRQIELMPANGGAARAITKTKFGVQQFAWRPDGRALAYITQDDPPARIAQHRDFVEITDDDYLTRSNDPPSHLWLVDAGGAPARRLTSGTWSAATSYPPSPPASPLSWTPDGKTLVFARVPNTHDGDAYLSEIDLLDVASGAVRPLTDRHKLESFAAVSPDGRRVAYLASRGDDPNNANAVFVTGVAGGRGSDVSAQLDRNPFRAIWTDDHTLLVGSNDGVHQSMWLLHDDGTSQRVDTGGAEVNQGFWLQAAAGKNGAVAFVGTTTLRPSELYYAPNAATPARRLTHVNDAVAALQLGRTEEVAWSGPDGWKQNGVLTYPPSFTPGKKYPLALVIHGGPTSASGLTFSGLAQSMAARGIIVFQPNYRGSDNGGNAYQRAIYMDAGDGPGRDVMAGLAAVERTGNVDEARIGVSGWSYGGYMTSWLMTHYHPWKTAFSGAAVNDLVDEYDFSDGNVQIAFAFHGSPHVGNNLADYRAQSPITYALDVTCPVTIMSDIGDARVPVTQSFRMYRTLKDNNRPVRFIGIPVDGHNPGDIVRRIERERYWTDWAAQGL